MLATEGRVVATPSSSAPLPKKYPAVTFPVTFTCPATMTFPGADKLPVTSANIADGIDASAPPDANAMLPK